MALRVAAGRAAEALRSSSALLVTAGAGMGVDSGLPDFRGTEGLWKAYPPLAGLGLSFADMANPDWFERDPSFAWGFYGHRLLLYRRTVPHSGFQILRSWGESMADGHFVFTSNVDGQFQVAGFDEARIVECHGSIHYLQGLRGGPIMSAEGLELPEVDPATLRVPDAALPRTLAGGMARPNILMFGDWGWDRGRTSLQRRAFSEWALALGGGPIAVVELGAGEAVPTVRRMSEAVARKFDGYLVRINPRESEIPADLEARGASLACGAAEGLAMIDRLWREPGGE